MKLVALLLISASAAFAKTTVLADETFTTTFSDYGDLTQVLECHPGTQGNFPTPDVLVLRSHTIELGLDVDNQPFLASLLLEEVPGQTRPPFGPRPFEEGCQPALDAFRQAIEHLDIVEVQVHRKLTVRSDVHSRVRRNREGAVQSVTHLRHQTYFESFTVEVAGKSFTLGRSLNGLTDSLP